VTTYSKTPARPGRHCNSGTNCGSCKEQVKVKAEMYNTNHRQISHQIIIPYTYKALRCDISFRTETRLRSMSPRKRFWAVKKKIFSAATRPKLEYKNHLLHLVGILFPHINDDARSKSLRIWNILLCSIYVAAIYTGGIFVWTWNRILTSYRTQVKNRKNYISALPYAFVMRCLINPYPANVENKVSS
jgi:hypothetical protein